MGGLILGINARCSSSWRRQIYAVVVLDGGRHTVNGQVWLFWIWRLHFHPFGVRSYVVASRVRQSSGEKMDLVAESRETICCQMRFNLLIIKLIS